MNLKKREREVLQCAADGLNIDQTADKLHLSRSSVEKLLASSKQATGSRTVIQAVYRAARAGLIVWCAVMIYQTGELRRVSRSRRRDQYEFLQQAQHSDRVS